MKKKIAHNELGLGEGGLVGCSKFAGWRAFNNALWCRLATGAIPAGCGSCASPGATTKRYQYPVDLSADL